ncbi:unnamed protein product [Brassica napus]|uniref:(rape) hypothetical protein n=1 Tax=Brassica napus TaxID=3708 RepID=A0A816IHW2_BRANA|nr:unnamed protein product [Brassica napus]
MQLPITVDMGCRKAIRRRMWEANRMFREMLFRVFAPDVVTYNCLIDGCCKTNRIGRALELFEDMKKRECVPNSVTNEIERGVEMMRMMGHGVPGSSTNTPLIHALVETRRVAEARGDGGGRSSHPNKGSLVKSLREAATTLSQIEQPLVTETVSKKQALKLLEAELKPLKKSIIKHDLLKNLVTCIFVELTAYFVQLSACFPDASKAEDFFHKFDQMDDTSIFDALTLLLDELTFTKAPTIRLSNSTSADTQLKASVIKLLLFSELLEDNDSFADEVTEALSKAAPYISANFSDYSTVLEKMCLEGTRSQAKHAVSAIASLARHLKNLSFPSYARPVNAVKRNPRSRSQRRLRRGFTFPATMMQATIYANRLSRFRSKLAAGTMYTISGYDVARCAQNFRLTDSPLMIRFNDSTAFDELAEPVSPLPEEGFRFRDQSELIGLANTSTQLPDIVGEIIAVKSNVSDTPGEKSRPHGNYQTG